MLTYVREPAVMVELASFILKSPRLIRLGLGLDEAPARLVGRDGAADEVEEARAGRELPVDALRPVDIDNAQGRHDVRELHDDAALPI